MPETLNTGSSSQFFDRLVLISNSVPKSGSTLLYSLQQNFLLALCGKPAPNLTRLVDAGIQVDGGYIPKPHSKEFLALIADKSLTGGPYIVKTHTLINADLREAFVASENVFASMSIRDPLDIFFSARDNFKKSGEFPEFASVEHGCETVNGYFARIYEAATKTSARKQIPIVRYDQIVTDPVGALLASLHGAIKDHVMRKIVEGNLNLENAVAGASKRLNLGVRDRRSRDEKEADFDVVNRSLVQTRQAFGYK